MNRKLNILFLGGAKRVAMARLLIEAGKRLDTDVEIFGYELDSRVPLASVGRILPGLRWSDPQLDRSLQEIADRWNIDMMLPFVDGAIEPVARFINRCHGVVSPVSPTDVSAIFFDKIRSAEAFEHASLPIPATFRGIPTSYPVIAKPRFGSASKGIVIIRSREEFDRAGIAADKYLVQEYIADRTEITADCFIGADGEILAVSPRIRLETAGGEAVRTITISDPECVSLAERVIGSLGLRGAVTIQFLRDNADGRLMLMEINPRLGGGVVASIHAGADIASLIIGQWLRLPLKRLYALPDVLTTRYLQEVVFFPDEN